MQSSRPAFPPLAKRALTSLVAICAVTAILGAKAMEWEHRADEAQATHEAAARLASGS